MARTDVIARAFNDGRLDSQEAIRLAELLLRGAYHARECPERVFKVFLRPDFAARAFKERHMPTPADSGEMGMLEIVP